MVGVSTTEEIDQVYYTLAAQSATLVKVYDKLGNFVSLPWLLLLTQGGRDKQIESLKEHLDELSSKYLETKRVDTPYFVALAVFIYILRSHYKDQPLRMISSNITEAMSAILSELDKNKRLRTPEMLGSILFFLSDCEEFSRQKAKLSKYLKSELERAIKAENCAATIDSAFGLLPLGEDFDFHIFQRCLQRQKLINIERLAKSVIILSQQQDDLKERYYVCLRERLQEEYVLKLSKILQSIINGISLVESDLSDEDANRVFKELRKNEWAEAINIEGKQIKLRRISPDFLRVLNAKTLGLCMFSFEVANKKTKISLYPDDFSQLMEAWNEKKFGFGVNKRQIQYLHYSSIVLLFICLCGGLWAGFGGLDTIIADIQCMFSSGFDPWRFLSTSIFSLAILLGLALIATYHRVFRALIRKGELTGFHEVLLMFPLLGRILKFFRGE